MSARPNVGVRRWYAATSETSMYISVLSIGEIRKGLAKLVDERRVARIGTWLDTELMQRFDQRLLSVDLEVCSQWGSMCGNLLRRGRPKPAIDSLLAATAHVHGLTLVTRNTRDFMDFDVKVINPWQ